MNRKPKVKSVNLPRLVPWGTWGEWESVRRWLFSRNPQERMFGVKRVKAWASRGSVPLAVDATAVLVEIILTDIDETNQRSEMEKRLQYGMGLTRFVNGLLDQMQGGRARSIAVIAEDIGLPRVFVDLRHESTHSQLPSLTVLRSAATNALNDLEARYWKNQHAQLRLIRQTLQYYLQEYIWLRKQPTITPEAQQRNAEELTHCLGDILNTINPNHVKELLIPILLDDPNFIPLYPYSPGSDSSLPESESFDVVKRQWSPALQRFSDHWPYFMPTLLLTLLESLNKLYTDRTPNDGDAQRLCMYMSEWADHLLRTKQFTISMYNAGVEMPYRALVQKCLKYPNKWTKTILIALLSLMQSPEQKKKVSQLMSLFPMEESCDGKEIEFDLAVFEQFVEEATGAAAEMNKSDTNECEIDEQQGTCWEQCDSWHLCPLGILPPNHFPDLQLPAALDDLAPIISLVHSNGEKSSTDSFPGESSNVVNIEIDEAVNNNNNNETRITKKRKREEASAEKIEPLYSVEELLSLSEKKNTISTK